MRIKKLACLLVAASLLVFGCAKEIEMEQSEIAGRKVLVMVSGKPRPYVWSMGGTMGAAVAFGLIGTGAAALVASEKGRIFDEVLVDYQLNQKTRDAVMKSVSETTDMEVVPVCFEGEAPGDAGCVAVPDEQTLKQDYSGQLLLAVAPCEYGLRNQKPYLALSAGYFDIDSGKAIWRFIFTLKNQEIPEEAMDLKAWTSDTEKLCNCLDCQIKEIGSRIANNVKTGEVPEQDPAWIFMGCDTISQKTCFE